MSKITPHLTKTLALVFGALASTVSAAEPNPLLTPKEAIQRMALPKDFSVDLLASEPDLVQPIAFCWDERGRIWVVEGNTYPTRAGKPPVPRSDEDPHLDQLNAEETASLFGGADRILILSDEDGDGVYETRKVFLEGLNLVSGIEVGFGGVYIGAAPYFLHIPLDGSGDKPSGPPRVLADGFGWHDTHETLNSFTWGPDGWLYGCHGVFTQSKVRNCTGPAGPRARVPMNCAYWRWHPVRQEFEVFAQGTSNPWGLDYNSKGQFFAEACVIPHFWHVIQGAYYLRQSNPLGHFNPYVYKNIETIADHSHFVGKTHQADKSASDDAGGGHAHCGLAIYDGVHFPVEYRNRPFLGNIHGKRINSEQIIPKGSGFKASHAPDFLKSNDFNFTAVTIKTAPDGSLVFSDWYDRQKCHNTVNEIWDRNNGRLYRVHYKGWKPWKATPGIWDPASTLDLQLQPNGWLSRMARRKVEELCAASKVEPTLLSKAIGLLKATADPDTRLRIMWWLHATRDSGNSAVWKNLLSDSDPYVRLWAIQLNVEHGAPDPDFVSEMVHLAKADASPVVRLALCSALQRLPHLMRWDLLDALLKHEEDNNDHNLPQMLWYAIEPMVPQNPEKALALVRDAKVKLPISLVARRLAEMQTPATQGQLLQAVADSKTANDALLYLSALGDALKGKFHLPLPAQWNGAYENCSKLIAGRENSETGVTLIDLRLTVGAAFGDSRSWPALRTLARMGEASSDRRQKALQTLALGKDPELADLLVDLFKDDKLRVETLKQGASLPVSELGPQSKGLTFFQTVLARYADLNADEKATAILSLSGRSETANLLLEAVASKKVPRADVSVFAARQIAGLNDTKLTELLERVWGIVRGGDKDEVAKAAEKEHARLKGILSYSFMNLADVSNGRLLFKNICGQCHQLFGEGALIGPDLTGSNRANIDYILENVTNPNAIIGKDYELHIFNLKDGRVVSGMVRQETDTTFTVRTMTGEDQVQKAEIKSEEKPGISMMPAGLFSALPKEQMRDLAAYLKSPKQVPLPGETVTTPTVSPVNGALEGESLKVLTSGRKTSVQNMEAFRDGVWSGKQQLLWREGKVGDLLELVVGVSKTGKYKINAVFTRAPDYAVVRFQMDHKSLGQEVDLFGAKVSSTQELTLGEMELSAGEHAFCVELKGANPDAKPGLLFGLDYLLLVPQP